METIYTNYFIPKSKLRVSLFLLFGIFILFSPNSNAQTTLMGWDVNGEVSYGTQGLLPANPAANNKLTSVTGFTRGSGVTTSGSAASNAWGGTGWINSYDANSTSNITFGFKPVAGYAVSVTSINPFGYRRSTAGPSSGQLMYSVDEGVNFYGVSNSPLGFGSDSPSGATISVDLNPDADMNNQQNAVTFKLIPYGASSSSGTFYFFNTQSGSDFSINGRILGSETLSLSGFESFIGFASSVETFVLKGDGLTASPVVLTAPAGYEVSSDNSVFNSTLSITPSSGVINSTVYVRLSAAAAVGSHTGNLTMIGGGFTGAADLKVALSGEVKPYPVVNVTQSTSFLTIQAAIDDAATVNGDVITVAAGTYAENVIVNKELTINGPNAVISPNGGIRATEAIVVPATSGADAVFTIQSNDVTIAGFLIDGDNAGLTSGVIGTNGADIDAYEGVIYSDPLNALVVDRIKVENNIIQNFQYFGVDFSGWYNYNNPATSGHVVNNNLIKDLGTYNSGNGYDKWGGGVLIHTNQYTSVTNNVMTNVRLGIQTGRYSKVNPGGPESQIISNNSIQARRIGIFHNFQYGNASPLTFSSNTITGLNNVNETAVRGILLSYSSISSSVIDNVIDMSGVSLPTSGIEVWDVGSSTPSIITGGTISNVKYGIFLNNYDGYSTNAPTGAHASISGVTINPNFDGIGIRLLDNPAATSHAAVQATLGAGIILNGGIVGLSIENASSQVVSPTGNITFNTQTGDYVKLIANTNDVDMSAASFDGKTGTTATLAENFAIEDKITHEMDNASLGSVSVKGTEWFVTTNSGSIQRAIELSSNGDKINVNDGTYNEDISVTKEVSLKSASGSANTTISGVAATRAINIASDNVTVEGFTVSNNGRQYGIYANNKGGLNIKDNHVTDVGVNTLVSTAVYGIVVEATANAVDDINITGNTVDDINGGNKGSIGAIAVGFSTGDYDLTNLTIDNNTITDIDAATAAWPDGRGAYGILLNLGSSVGGTGRVVSPVITNNNITDLEGLWATGIGLEGDTPGAIVTGNSISDLTDHKGPSVPDASGVKIESNDGAATVVINNNDFFNIGSGTTNDGFGVNNFTTTLVNADNNYWGAADGPSGEGVGGGVKVTANVTFCPFYDDVVLSGAVVGCRVKNVDTGETFASIQAAIDDSDTDNGDIIEVESGTYDEQVFVNKELTINGVGTTKPIISFTGTAVGKNAIFDISADKVTINNFEIDVDLTKLSSGIVATSAGLDDITISNNTINAKGSSNAVSTGSYGQRNAISINYAGYRVATGGVDNISVMDNIVTAVADDGFGVARTFRSGVSVDEGGGTYTGNDFTSISHDILIRFNSNGSILIDDNDFRGGGVQVAAQNAGGGQLDISNNTFDSPFANTYTSSLRLQYNNQNKLTNVTGNAFNNHNWGISLENYKNVSIDNNIFTPLAGSTTYRHITTNTKVIATDAPPISQTAIDASFTNNIFNGSGSVGGTALVFYNHDDANDSYGTFVIGSEGNENTFNDGIGSFMTLGDETGPTSGLAASYGYTGIPSTTAACWSVDLDAKFNKYDLGSGAKLPTDLNFSERTALETKMYHKPDNACLAEIEFFLPIKNLTQTTSYATIAEAINAANANDVLEVSEGTYNERVIIDKSLTLRGVAGDSSLQVIDGTGLGNGDGIQIANGVTDVSISNLTIQNFSGAGGNTDAGIYAIGGNNDLTVANVAIKNNVGGSGIYANGPVDGVSITDSRIEGHTSGARGIVIWNGFKENITITGNILSNNNCCGIELQDGSASAVNVSNNKIDIGIGDNAIGLTGMNELTGTNLIDNNVITGGGRFGIEIKNPSGGVTVSNNSVTLSSQNADLRDRAGIAVFRRGYLAGNADIPNGVSITGNTVTGYQQVSDSEGFGIIVEGTNHVISGNTLEGNDVAIQQQAGHGPYTANTAGDGNQNNLADLYFGRGNSPEICNITLTGNSYTSNGVDERIVVGGGTGTIVTEITPTVDDPTDVEACNGVSIAEIAFTGNNLPGVVYNWTNTNTAIGLAASGTGNIASYTATNTTALTVSATITVTPVVNGCAGTPQEFTITINPSPVVDVIANQTVCSGQSITPIAFSGNATTYNWTNDNTSIGLALSGTGDIASFTATNTTGVPQIAYIVVTPTFTGGGFTCEGSPGSFSLIVNDDAAAEIICQDDATMDNDAGLCSAIYNFDLPYAFDPQFFDGFESSTWDNSYLGWTNYNSDLSRELSGSVTAADGTAYGSINTTVDGTTGVFSRLGGYSSTFGNGFRTKVDVYIDLADPAVSGDTYGFDVSSAVNNQIGNHRRDFIFHAASNASGNVFIAGSNGTNFAKRNDLASLNHHEITTSGWYTFEWMFKDKGDGTLAVDMNLKDNTGANLFTETRNTPADVIASEIGGNRYMWFTFIAADNLKIDNVEKASILTTTSDIVSGSAFPVGTTTVTVTAEPDACGNQATCTFDVTVNDIEAPTFTSCPTDAVICADDATYSWNHVTLTDICALSGGLQELTYTLSGATTTASPVVVTSYDGSTMGTETFNEGVTTVTYTGKDAAGNLVSNACSFTVTVDEVAVVDAGTYAAICKGESVVLNGSFSGAASSITWSDGAVGGSFAPSATDLTATYTPPANYVGSITLTIASDDPTGPCAAVSANTTLVVNALPTVSILSVTPLCEGGDLTIQSTSTAADTYAWTGPNSFTSGDANASIPAASALAHGTYTLVVTSVNLCTASATVAVTVYPLPTAPTITSDNSEICKGSNAVLSASCSSVTDVFRWTTPPINNGGSTSSLNSSSSQVVTAPGTYTGYCESENGCIGPDGSITITEGTNCGSQNFITVVPEIPYICPGASISLTASGCATGTVTWSGSGSSETGATVSLSPAATTTYVVSCSTGGSTTVEVKVAQPNVTVTNNVSTGKAIVKAVNTIEANKKVGDPNVTPAPNVIYEAGNSILLQPGFVAQGAAVFKAEIKVCN